MAATKQRRRRRAVSWVERVFQAWERVEESRSPMVGRTDDWPEWVQNVALELAKVVYPRPALKRAKNLDAASLGALLGRHYAVEAFLLGEVPAGPKVQQEWARLAVVVKKSRVDRAAVARFVEQWENQDRPALRAVLVQAFALALEQPYPEALAFLEAFARAARIEPDELASEYAMTRSTRVYFVLFTLWRAVEKAPSLGALHRMLCQAGSEERAGDLKSFEKLCQKVGLKLRGRGRPPKGG